MTEEGAEEMTLEMSKLMKQLSNIIDISMESLCCVFFSLISDKVPTSKLYSKWSHPTKSSPDVIMQIFESLNSLLVEFADHLEPQSFLKLMGYCQDKIVLWYLYLLREVSADQSFRFTRLDCDRVSADYEVIVDFFKAFIDSLSAHGTMPSSDAIMQRLNILERLRILICEPVGSLRYTKTVCEFVDTCVNIPRKAESVKLMLQSVFSLKEHQHIEVKPTASDDTLFDEGEIMGGDNIRQVAIQQLQDIIKRAGSPHTASTSIFDPLEIAFSPRFNSGSLQLYLVRSVLERRDKEKDNTASLSKRASFLNVESINSNGFFSNISTVTNEAVSNKPLVSINSHFDNFHAPDILKNLGKTSSDFLSSLHVTLRNKSHLELSCIEIKNLPKLVNSSRSDPSIEFSINGKSSHTAILPFASSLSWKGAIHIPLVSSGTNESVVLLKYTLLYKVSFFSELAVGEGVLDITSIVNSQDGCESIKSDPYTVDITINPDVKSRLEINSTTCDNISIPTSTKLSFIVSKISEI
jgi:hypothetical protein